MGEGVRIREANHLILYKMALSIVWNGFHRAFQMLIDKDLDIREYLNFTSSSIGCLVKKYLSGLIHPLSKQSISLFTFWMCRHCCHQL